MAEKENIAPRRTRAAAKRAASPSAAAAPVPSRSPTKRNRIALAELRFLSNATSDCSAPRSKNKAKTRKKAKFRPAASSDEITPRVDPQMCKSYSDRSVPRSKGKARTRKKVKLRPASSSDDITLREDPQMCTSYASDICQYLRSMEAKPNRRPLPNYMESVQRDITAGMREVMVNWLVEVALDSKLVSETLYLTVSYIDRFLSLNAIARQRLQLLGVSCLLIASKYEEITPPPVNNFCDSTDNAYTIKEVVEMEREILKSLRFELGNPTANTFLRQFMQAFQQDGKVHHSNLQIEFMASYLAELSLMDYDCVQFLPSLVAASAIFLARFTLDPNSHPWCRELEQSTRYCAADLTDCVHAIHNLQLKRKTESLAAIGEKYQHHEFQCVSTLLSPAQIPANYLS
ncbi:cyclin-A3-1-like [Zingiber officinale]|uniref:cyclin-A3-1-like n=1 Tax=Zingiber officinale TaxID=94328 RepID=UPI001C4CCE00|nr:cyclin-A3-1-like [Zingiber officinale]